MNANHLCPICGAQIVFKSEQFRSDDEPSTLVSMCPLHGTVGNLCKLYLRSQRSSTITVCSTLCPSDVPQRPTYTINRNSTESWVDDAVFYVMKVDIINPVMLDVISAKHISVKPVAL